LLLALPMLFFAAEAGAAVCGGMFGEGAGYVTSKINVVASVKVNELEWTNGIYLREQLITTQKWLKAFGEKGVVTEVSHLDMDDEMCTPRHVATVIYPDKTIRLTIPWLRYVEEGSEVVTESEFKAIKVDQDFVKRGGNWPARLAIDWNLKKFKDSLVVGGHAIRSDLSFKAFEKLFPLSAQHSVAALLSQIYDGEVEWHERKNDTQTYIVEVSYSGEANCLDQTVEFTFSEGKLSGLALRDYQEWCSC
jgi:hypothetical protein